MVKHDAEIASKFAYRLFWLLAATMVIQYSTVALFSWFEKADIVEKLSGVFNTWLSLVSSFFGAAATTISHGEETLQRGQRAGA